MSISNAGCATSYSSPRVSIVIPAYNAADFLDATIGSVRAQSLTEWEVIVVDDGSTDDTAAIVEEIERKDPRVKLLSQPNRGVALARNRGFAETSEGAPYVVFLDHDDLYLPESLQILVDLLESHPDTVAAHGQACQWSEQNGAGKAMDTKRRRITIGGRVRDSKVGEPTTFETLAYDCCLCTPGLALIRRAALTRLIQGDDARPFDPAMAPADDWDLWLRLTALGPIAFQDFTALYWRMHSRNESRDGARMLARQSDVRRKTIRDPHFSPAQRALMYRRYCGMIASETRKKARRQGLSAAATASFVRYLWIKAFWRSCRDRGAIPWQHNAAAIGGMQ